MFKIWNAANFRRTVAGWCLITSPLLLAGSVLLMPGFDNDASKQLTGVAAHRGNTLAGSLLIVGFVLLFIPGLVGILHRIRARGLVFGHVAGLLLYFGSVMTGLLGAFDLVSYQMTGPGMDRASMVRLLHALYNDKAVMLPLILGTNFLFNIGLVLLGVALWRSHLVPRWAAICVILYALTGYLPASAIITLASLTLGVVGLGTTGGRLLTSSDASWDELTAPAATSTPTPAATAAIP